MVNNNSYCQVMACLRENGSSHFVIEVKSCWAGFVSGWVTILVFLCCMPGEERLVLCFTLAPPTSAIVCGLSFSQSHPDMGFFLWVLWFFSLSKSTPSQKHLVCVLCSGIIDDNWRQPEVPLTCIWLILLSCTLRNSGPGAASKG